MDKMRVSLALILTVTFANTALAKARFNLAGAYASEEHTREGANSKGSTTVFNLSLAGDVKKNAFIGFKYYDHVQEDRFEITAAGIVFGYLDNSGFMVAASWILNPEKTFTESNIRTVHKSDAGLELNGLVVDVAFFMKAGSFLLGPQITYAQFDYNKAEVGGTTSELDNTGDEFITPFVSLMYEM